VFTFLNKVSTRRKVVLSDLQNGQSVASSNVYFIQKITHIRKYLTEQVRKTMSPNISELDSDESTLHKLICV